MRPTKSPTLVYTALCVAGWVVGGLPSAAESPKAKIQVERELCSGKGFAETRRTYFGAEASSLTPELRRHFGVAADRGVLISRVMEDGPAAKAGLQVGDVLTSFEGDAVGEPQTLGRALRAHDAGEKVTVEVYRDGRRQSMRVELGSRQSCAFDVGQLIALEGLGNLEELKQLESFESLGDLEIKVDVDEILHTSLAMAMAGIQEALAEQDWQRELERVKKIDVEALGHRMEEVQRELEQLERKLESESDEYREKARVELEKARSRVAQEKKKVAQQLKEIESEVERAQEHARRELEQAQEEAQQEVERQKSKKGGAGQVYRF